MNCNKQPQFPHQTTEDWIEPDEIYIICLEPNNMEQLICGLECSCHYMKYDNRYHKDCIVKWIQRSGKCPICCDPAKIRFLQAECCYYYPQSNFDDILLYDFDTMVKESKKIEFDFTRL